MLLPPRHSKEQEERMRWPLQKAGSREKESNGKKEETKGDPLRPLLSALGPLGEQLLITATSAKKRLLEATTNQEIAVSCSSLSAPNGALGNALLTALGWGQCGGVSTLAWQKPGPCLRTSFMAETIDRAWGWPKDRKGRERLSWFLFKVSWFYYHKKHSALWYSDLK